MLALLAAILTAGLVLVGLTDAQSPAPSGATRELPDIFANDRNLATRSRVIGVDTLQTENFQLSPGQLLRLTGPGFNGVAAERAVMASLGIDKTQVPGSSLTLSGTTLHVKQTAKNIERIRMNLTTNADAPFVSVKVPPSVGPQGIASSSTCVW